MNCWWCKKKLIWEIDHNIEAKNKDYDIVTNLSCPKCHAVVNVYHPSAKLLKEQEDYDKDRERVKKISRDYIKNRDAKKK